MAKKVPQVELVKFLVKGPPPYQMQFKLDNRYYTYECDHADIVEDFVREFKRTYKKMTVFNKIKNHKQVRLMTNEQGGGLATGPKDGRGLGPQDGRGGKCSGRKKKRPDQEKKAESMIDAVLNGISPEEVIDEVTTAGCIASRPKPMKKKPVKSTRKDDSK